MLFCTSILISNDNIFSTSTRSERRARIVRWKCVIDVPQWLLCGKSHAVDWEGSGDAGSDQRKREVTENVRQWLLQPCCLGSKNIYSSPKSALEFFFMFWKNITQWDLSVWTNRSSSCQWGHAGILLGGTSQPQRVVQSLQGIFECVHPCCILVAIATGKETCMLPQGVLTALKPTP